MATTMSKRVSGYLTDFVAMMKGYLKTPDELAGSIFVDMDMKHREQAIRDEFTIARDSHIRVNWAKIAAMCAVACIAEMTSDEVVEEVISPTMVDSSEQFEEPEE